ncbi:MAG: molybdopterin-guanine dinucleotide biosynthesis protein B [Methanolinea sp.]
MRVIHIAGVSGSGKTTFIRALLPLLNKKGTTAVVKHLAHHHYILESDKDTTHFFHGGTLASAGADPEKTVLVLRDTALSHIMSILSSIGTKYMLIEGWKTLPFPKITIGALPGAEGVVLTDPTAELVLESLEKFPHYHSLQGLSLEVQDSDQQGVLLAGKFPVHAKGDDTDSRREFYLRFSPILDEITREAGSSPGDVRVGLHLHQGLLFGGEDAILMAVGSQSPHTAIRVFSSIQERLFPVAGGGKIS